MRIRILSDLHLEFHDFDPGAPDADVVVLAGDTHVGERGVLWAMQRFPDVPVVYVIGNHEYYGQTLPLLRRELPAMTRGTGVHVLEDEAVVIGGVRFLGCTLWSDWNLYGNPREHMPYAQQNMADFFTIRVPGDPPEIGERPFTPADARALHRNSVAWLRRELESPAPVPTVVVTHNAPARGSVAARFAGHPLTPAFVTDLEDLVAASGARLWVHGHVHDCFDYRVGATRVLCNPRGYPDERDNGFEPGLVVEV